MEKWTPCVRNKEVTGEGWYILINALYHAHQDTGWPFTDDVKDVALGWKATLE